MAKGVGTCFNSAHHAVSPPHQSFYVQGQAFKHPGELCQQHRIPL